MQMLWKNQKCLLLMAVLMLSCSALCLETVLKGKSVQSGKLIIGSSSIASKTKGAIGQKVHDEYAQDTHEYQSDQPDLMGSQLAKIMLRSWCPSVWCNNDSMTLRMQESRLPAFLVETSEKDPVPLSQMASDCVFPVKSASGDVSLVAKYEGCNVAQQGNAYILPLYVLGLAVKMVCPVVRPVTTVSCSPSAMVVNLDMSLDAVRLKVNDVWEPVYQASTSCGFTVGVVRGVLILTAPYTSNCWLFEGTEMHLSVQYMDGELMLSCPAVKHFPPTTPLPRDSVGCNFNGYSMPRYVHHEQPGTLSNVPTTKATTTMTKNPTTPATIVGQNRANQPLWYQWLPGKFNPYAMPRYVLYGQPATLTNALTTVASPTSAKNPNTQATIVTQDRDDQPLWYAWLPGRYNPYAYAMPWYVNHGEPGTLTNVPTTTGSTTQATIVAHDCGKRPLWYPWLLGRFNPYAMPRYVHHVEPGTLTNDHITTASTALSKIPATIVAPTNQRLWYPWLQGGCKSSGYGMPCYFHHRQSATPTDAPRKTTTTPPATPVAPSAASQPILYPWLTGIKNYYTRMGSAGVKRQYSVPWMSALQVHSGLGSKSNDKLSIG